MRKVLLATSLLCVALLFALLPAVSVDAQGDGTATPMIIVVTATPAGGSGDTVTSEPPTPDTAAPTGGEDVPMYIQAIRATYPALSKKITRGVAYIRANLAAYTYDAAAQVKECKLKDGEKAPLGGDVYGWLVTLTFYNKNTYAYFVTYDLKTVFECTAGTSTGASTSNSNAPLGKAAPGSFEAGAHIYDFGPGTVARLKTAKLKWIKKQIQYGDGGAKGVIDSAHAQGFKVLLAVVGDKNALYNPGYFDQYAAYVGGLANGGADAIEVWNEMNLDREWPNGKINPAEYTDLLKKSFDKIKQGNPNTLVISGALAPTGAAGPGGKTAAYWNDDVYYSEMAAAGAGQYMDCVGLHYNEGIVSPNQASGDPRDNYPTRYFTTMLNRAMAPFPGKSGCFTELGFLTGQGYGPLPAGFVWAKDVTLAQQAQWLAEAAVKASQAGNVRLMIIWNMDFVRYDSDPMAGYAMIRPDGTCPACEKLATVLN